MVDTGSNISVINYKVVIEKNFIYEKVTINNDINTVNGKTKFLGRVNLLVLIGTLKEKLELLIVESLNCDILLGLDAISLFNLNITDELKVFQVIGVDSNDMIIKDEILSNYSAENTVSVSMLIEEQIMIKHLTSDEYKTLCQLIEKYQSVFSQNKFDIGRINIEHCRINTSNENPIYLRPYRCSEKDQKNIDEQCSILLKHGLIRKSISSYSFPITLVNKKDDGEKQRLCIDYRKLNTVTIADNYPFPRIEDIVDKLYGSKYFSTFDISSGFWQIPVDKKDIHKTAFVTQTDHYEWLVMPFGLRNAPALFQRIISEIIRKHDLAMFCHNYIDDILVHSSNFTEHINHIEKVLLVFKEENIKLKMSKCNFAQLSVNYLGHRIAHNKVFPINDNLKAIREYEHPKNVKELQRFLGKINYYRRFIQNASSILKPLYDLLKKERQFVWSEDCQKSFDKVKDILQSKPVLQMYNPNLQCYVFTDASKIGIGAILKQIGDDNLLHPVSYFSKRLLKYQENYSIPELECLAIVESIDFWHHYLYGKRFIVLSDHNALKWLKNVKKPNSRLFRWSLKLDQYNFEIRYQPGKMNTEADALSRCPIIYENDNAEHLRFTNYLTINEIKNEQNKELKNEIPKKCYKRDGIVYNCRKGFVRTYVPFTLREKLINTTHTNLGHIGITKMINTIAKSYCWPNLAKDIKQFVDKCEACQMNKRPSIKYGELLHLPFAQKPLEWVSIDTIGGLGQYNSTYKYLHVAIDHLTRYIWIKVSKTQVAHDFIQLVLFVSRFGNIKNIFADQYPSIKSKEFRTFLEINDINITFSPPDTPHSNGLVERANKTLIERLKIKRYLNKKASWACLMRTVVDEYNNTPHSTTKFTPNQLLNGEQGLDLNTARLEALRRNKDGFVNEKIIFDSKHQIKEYARMDYVLKENQPRQFIGKLEPTYDGPYVIVQRKSNCIYEIKKIDSKSKSELVHVARLKPFVPS